MTIDQLKNSKVVIFSHFATTGACEELCDWLKEIGVRELVYVAFPFGRNPDRFVRAERYSGGRLTGTVRSLFRLKLPEPLAYAKDFLYTVSYAVRFGRGADVLVAGDNLLAWAATWVRRIARIKRVVYYMIDYTPVRYANRLLNALYCFVDQRAAYRADAVWPLTEKMIVARFEARRLEARRVRWSVVPYGSHPVRQEAAAAVDVRNVVYLGDVVHSKGAELFVPFARELKRLVPECTLTVIGGGNDLASLRAEVERQGLQDCVDVRGFLASFGEALALLVQAGVAIAPYYPFDPNSFTFYSDPGKVKVYLGCGVPVVLTDVPPIARMIAREGVGVIAAYEAADLAEKVASVMRSPDYAAMRARAAEMGQRYAWPRVFETAFARIDECGGGQEMSLVHARQKRLRRFAKSVCVWMLAFGLNPGVWRYAFRGLGVTLKEYRELKRQNRSAGNPFRIRFTMPCLGDRYDSSGTASGHYFFQDFIVARKIFERKPVRHVDVGSRVDGFVAHVASFRDIEVFDIRPLKLDIPSIIFRQADLTRLDGALRQCCDSLSCLHAIEHFGLGRYGDTIDLYGHVKGFENLSEVLKPGGVLYFSTPIGPERVDFNACRVFNIRTILDLAKTRFDLVEFSYVDDAGALHANADLTPERISENCGCDYGCGIFEFRRKQAEAGAI